MAPGRRFSTRARSRMGGVCRLRDSRVEDPRVPIREEHKMSVSQVRQELGADGFQIERVLDALPWQHIIVLRPAR